MYELFTDVLPWNWRFRLLLGSLRSMSVYTVWYQMKVLLNLVSLYMYVVVRAGAELVSVVIRSIICIECAAPREAIGV